MNQKISETLGLTNITQTKHGEILPPSVNETVGDAEDIAAKEDRDFARTNIKDVIQTGADAMQEMLDIARQTEDPKAFEVFSKILKAVVDANESLVNINSNSSKKQQQKKSESVSESDEKPSITNNHQNLYVGSTKDLLEIINKGKE
jgi:hypothetical protein